MRFEPDPIGKAITALTEAARTTLTVDAGSPNKHSYPVDFGSILCDVLTAVAANVGGVERLLSGRPRSGGAYYVREIVLNTAGESAEELLRWRTEPLRLYLDVLGQFADLGLLERYHAAADGAASREYEARQSIMLAFSTAEEKASLAAMRSERVVLLGDLNATYLDGERAAELADEASAIVRAVLQRAHVAGGPLVAAHAEAERTCEAIDERWEQDMVTYLTAYAGGAREALTERGVTVAVELIARRPADTAGEWAPLLDEIHERARISADLLITQDAPGLSRDEAGHRDGDPSAERGGALGHTEESPAERLSLEW